MIADSAIFMFGIQGKCISEEEQQWLRHPLTAGVVLFTRNYESPKQIKDLVKTIRQTATNDILIAVDHEGGRVQRFREGFTEIPPMATLGRQYDQDSDAALTHAKNIGYILAHEIAACDIDFSFAPVLDVQTSTSKVIGDRAFHSDVDVIAKLATAFYNGMHAAGLAGVGKHFPGHGNVVADSHIELPIIEENFNTIKSRDLPPFAHLIKNGIEAIMPAHILYTMVDGMPAGFSNYWLQTILRDQLGFTGCIISDDLDMAGAMAFGSMVDRINLAQQNCDLILLCNNQDDMRIGFTHMDIMPNQERQHRLTLLQRDKTLHNEQQYKHALIVI